MTAINSHFFPSNEELLEVEKVTKRKDFYQLVQVIQKGFIWTIGVKKGFFEIDPTLTFNSVQFDVEDILGINPRVQENQLLLDLWFYSEKTNDSAVLQERIKDGRRLILLTVIVTEIDYLSTGNDRYYWGH